MAVIETLKRRKRRFYKSLVLGLSISLLTSFAAYMGYLEGLETKALDFLLWLRGQQKSPEIIIVQIDDQAFRNLGEKQPLPRSYLAGLIDVIGRGGAKVIGVDIELKVPTHPREDEALVRAIRGAEENGVSKVVPVYVIRPEKEQDGMTVYTRAPFFSPKLAVVAGFADAPMEPDGFVRQVPLAVKTGDGKILPSLALAVLARYAGYDAARFEQAVNQGNRPVLLLPEWDKLSGALLPNLTPFSFQMEDSWKINFAGAQGSFKAIPSDPVFQLSKFKVPLARDNPFRNKIVLIGATFGDSRDFFPTPKGLMSGIEIHANIIHTLLSRSQILPAQRLLALVISLIFAVVMSLVLTLLRPSLVNILSFVAIPVLLVPSYWVFVRYGLWVDFVTPLLAIRWGAYVGDYLESRHVRKSLGEYVDREVANQIVDQEETIRSQKKEVSVFFTDVRNFTTLSERLPPEKIVGIINELFAMTGKIIARHQGCIVDFIGDAILAVFGAPKDNPNHALDAVQTAIEVQKELDGLNEKWQKRGIPAIQTGVGIHTGEVLAGIVGSGERKKFGVTGDTVNTGSRVEGLNKEFSTTILITRETLEKIDPSTRAPSGGHSLGIPPENREVVLSERSESKGDGTGAPGLPERLHGKIDARSRGQVKVKGREKPVEVFEVLIPGRAYEAIEEVL